MNIIKKHKLVLLFVAGTVLSLSLLTQIGVQRVYAAAGTWIDSSTIDINGQKYVDPVVGDRMNYNLTTETNCVDEIRGFNKDYNDKPDFSKATLVIRSINPETNQCEGEKEEPLTLSSTQNALGAASWIDSGAIQISVGYDVPCVNSYNNGTNQTACSYFNEDINGKTFNAVSGVANTYTLQTGACNSSIRVTSSGNATTAGNATLILRNGNTGCDADRGWVIPIQIAQAQNATKPPGTGTPTTPGDAASPEDATEDNSCESNGGVLGWIMCPVILLIDGVLNWLDTQIQGLLAIDTNKYTNPELKRAWANFRNIAYIILIPVMLVMVIGTALGFEVFSAYTVKRALPRMVIAVIFITLSWYIVGFIINFFNIVGAGVLGLMTSPFGNSGNINLSNIFGASAATGAVQFAGASAVLVGLVVVLVTPGGIGLILLYLGGAALFVFVAFLILILRQMFIIALILVAPLAIIAWIFPGNDKLWKLWWGTFSKLLIMFPLIMAIIASGRIFAYLIDLNDTGGVNAVLNPLLKLTAYILPYVFIPFTFKFAGGIFANLAGMVNDRSRGISDRLAKGRQATRAQMHKDTMEEKNRFGGSRLGQAYRRTARFGRDGSFGVTSASRNRWTEYNRAHREHAADEMNEAGGQRAFNDEDASELAIQEGMTKSRFIQQYSARMVTAGRAGTEQEGRSMAEQALARMELATGAKVGSEAMTVAAQKFRTSQTNTAYEVGPAGLQRLQEDLVSLQERGLITAVDAAGWMKANRGRSDYSANSFNDTVGFAAGTRTADQQLEGAFNGADPREIVGGHQRAIESFAIQAQRNVEQALQSGSQAQLDKALADVANIYDILSNISPKKANIFADIVMSQGVLKVPVWDASGETVYEDSSGTVVDKTTLGAKVRTRPANTTVRVLMNEAKSRPAGPNGQQTYLGRRRELSDAERASRPGEPPEERT